MANTKQILCEIDLEKIINDLVLKKKNFCSQNVEEGTKNIMWKIFENSTN